LRERMAAARRVPSFLRSLEDRIATIVSGKNRAALAYSGGLACTLLAMIARKHCELDCLVAGVEGSADFRAAKIAKDYLDYRIEYIRLDAGEIRRIRARVAASDPEMSEEAILGLIPLQAAMEQRSGRTLLTGFGSPHIDGRIATALRTWGIPAPLVDLAPGRRLPRSLLRSAAISLGLPEEWAVVTHRSPSSGSGIEDLLRASTAANE